MKTASILAAAILSSSCATYEYVPVQENLTLATRPDPAAKIMIQCDTLGMRDPQAARLCYMRGIDRLGVEHSITLPKAAPIQILPYAYPPLAPGNTIYLR